MALTGLTKITAIGINTTIIPTLGGSRNTGVVTASSFSGPMTNGSGISTFYDLRVSNNLTVEGTTSTLDTNLIGVDRIEVGANSNTVTGIAVTQSGTADIVRLYDGSTQVVTVDDVGNVGIGSAIPTQKLDVNGIVAASQGVRVPNGSATSNYISVGDSNVLRMWGTTHSYIDIRNGSLHFRNNALQNVLEIQQDKDVFFYGNTYLQNARFDQTVTIADTITHHGDTDTKIRFPAADTIQFETAGDARLHITNNGRVGINSISPTVPFDVVGSGKFSSALTVGGTLDASGTCTLGQTVSINGTNPRLQFVDTNHDSDYSIYGSNGRFSVYDDTNSAERFRINSTGKITHTYDGTAYDAQYGQFEITKNGASNADPDWSYLSFHRAGQIGWQQGIDSNHFVIATTGGSAKNTLDAEKLRITSGGKVNIGGDFTQTSYQLSVTDTGGNLFRIKTANEGDYDLRFMIQNSESNIWHYGTDDFVFGNRYDRKLHFITNAQKRLTIHGANVGINTATPGTYLHVKGTGEMLRLETTASGGGQCYIDFDDETATRASIGLRGSSSDTLTMAALNGSMRFDVSGKVQALQIGSTGNIQHDAASGISYFKGSSEYIFGSTTSSPPAGGSEASVQIHDYKTRAHFSINAYMNNAGGPFMQFISSRSGTPGTLGTKCASGDFLGDIRFCGDNGTNYNSIANGAQIFATAASTPGDGDTTIAGRLKFVTGTANAGSLPVVMEIREDGYLMLKRGRVNNNGSLLYCFGGFIAGTGTLSFDIPVFTSGNIYKIDAFYSHHSLNYGCYRYGVYGAYSGHSGLQINNDFGSHSSGNGGSFTISRGSAGQPLVVAKTAGTYSGQGYWFINVYAGNYTQL